MADDVALVDDEIEIETPRRGRGRPPKPTPDNPDGAVIASDAPNPRYKTYDTNSPNKNQKTNAAWAWWNALSPAVKQIIELNVYRDWPVMLEPLDDSDRKEIGLILGVEPVQTDQDFVDRFGAGDYRAYLNVSPKGDSKRTLFTAYIKCTHAFREFPPSDHRIDDALKVDVSDKSNRSYVAWLKGTGKLKDEDKDSKEKEDMAATSGVMAELVKDMAQDRRELTQKLLEKTEQDKEIPPDPPPSPQEVISEQLSIFKSLKELVPTSDPLEMVKQVIGMAQVLTQGKSDGSADLKPLMDEIAKLREESRASEREFFRTQLADMKEQLRVVKETPPPANVLLPDGSNLNDIIQRAVEKLVDRPEDNPWLDIAKQAMPVALPILGGILQRLMTPQQPQQAAPFPMPPQNFHAVAPQQQQAQLPAPVQPQQQATPAQQAQPAGSQEQLEVERILTAISAPVIDALVNGDDGDTFADYVREEYGAQAQRLIAKFQEAEIIGALYVFPLIAPRMAQFPQDRVTKFVKDFKEYDRDKYDAKMDAKGGAA